MASYELDLESNRIEYAALVVAADDFISAFSHLRNEFFFGFLLHFLFSLLRILPPFLPLHKQAGGASKQALNVSD